MPADKIRIPILYGIESNINKSRLNETKSDTPFFDNIAIIISVYGIIQIILDFP